MSSQEENVPSLKIVIIGDAQIGKSSLLFRFVNHRFPTMQNTTIGAAFYCKKDRENHVNFNMWDTAGQERFRSIIPMYLKNVNLVLFVYDISRKQTFENLKSYWVKYVSQNHKIEAPKGKQMKIVEQNVVPLGNEPAYQAILVGNKSDLEAKREVSKEEAEEFRQKLDIPFVEVSALNGSNIEELWDMIKYQLLTKFQRPDTSDVLDEPRQNFVTLGLKSVAQSFSNCRC